MHFCNCLPHRHSQAATLWPSQLRSVCCSSRQDAVHQQQPQQPQQQAAHAAAQDDPRLQWARREWLIPRPQQQQQQQALAGAPSSSPAAHATTSKQRRLLDRLTYGSLSSGSDEDDGGCSPLAEPLPGSSSGSSRRRPVQQHEQLFQALGVDFGQQRVGIAIRKHNHNVPLMTLHREQPLLLAEPGAGASHQAAEGQQQPKQKQQGSPQQGHQLLSQPRVAAAVLQLALEQGCDGFVIGLPEYPAAMTAAAAAVQQQPAVVASVPAAGANPGSRSARAGRVLPQRENRVIRAFAQKLADLAAPLELPVLLVNEQQSSQQARAVIAGAAAYDVMTLQQLETQQQQQQQQQQRKPKQQGKGRQPHQLSAGRLQVPGRDAFAAAVIVSRYYNGLVQPEQVPGNNTASSKLDDPSVRRQAVWDLKAMQVPPGEQLRRQRQRQRQQQKTAGATVVQAATKEPSGTPTASVQPAGSTDH